MPIHSDWQELYRSFVEQYGAEKGEGAFYAYCKKHGIDYTKPQPKRESFSWVGDLSPLPGNLVRGKALHPIKTVHLEEWPSVRVYLEEELSKSAQTLAGKPLLLDHGRYINGKVLSTAYEDGAIEYIAELNDQDILSKIRDGKIKHCSVEFEWQSLQNVDGIAPRGINFVGLSLLSPGVEPGDPSSSVEMWETVLKSLKEAKARAGEQAEPQQEFIYYAVRDPAAFLEDRFSTVWIDRFNGIQGIYGRLRDAPENPQPMALLFMKANNWDTDRVKLWVQEHPQYLKGPEEAPPAVYPHLQIEALQNQLGIVTEQKKTLEGALKEAEAKIRTLEERLSKKPLGEAVVSSIDSVSKKEILALLPERVPIAWGYGPFELIQKLKRKVS